MAELLLCKEPIAAMPFYMDGLSVNLYSLEEMSYYILNNTYLLENDFMSEELCTWIDKELGRVSLAEKLRDLMRAGGKLVDYISLILNDSGYCTKEEIRYICSSIQDMADKSEFECAKLRADRLMERGKVLAAIYEYKRLLASREALVENPELVGKIWHNLACAYARLFLFEESIRCYHMAYELGKNPQSMREELLAYRCMKDEEGFIRAGIAYGLDEMKLQEIRNELTVASRNLETSEFEERLEQLARMEAEGEKASASKELMEIITLWKNDYRRMSKI